jgi:hypothetical protein
VFTARYALSPYIKQIRFVFKGLIFVFFFCHKEYICLMWSSVEMRLWSYGLSFWRTPHRAKSVQEILMCKSQGLRLRLFNCSLHTYIRWYRFANCTKVTPQVFTVGSPSLNPGPGRYNFSAVCGCLFNISASVPVFTKLRCTLMALEATLTL